MIYATFARSATPDPCSRRQSLMGSNQGETFGGKPTASTEAGVLGVDRWWVVFGLSDCDFESWDQSRLVQVGVAFRVTTVESVIAKRAAFGRLIQHSPQWPCFALSLEMDLHSRPTRGSVRRAAYAAAINARRGQGYVLRRTGGHLGPLEMYRRWSRGRRKGRGTS